MPQYYVYTHTACLVRRCVQSDLAPFKRDETVNAEVLKFREATFCTVAHRICHLHGALKIYVAARFSENLLTPALMYDMEQGRNDAVSSHIKSSWCAVYGPRVANYTALF